MEISKTPKNKNVSLLNVIIIIVLICVVPFVALSNYNKIKQLLRDYLSVQDQLPKSSSDALYILGGSSTSTYRHIIAAAEIYKNKKTNKILIFSSLEKNEYDPILNRNLTNNEWIVKHLVERGVSKDDIDTVLVSKGRFGTLSEARDVTKYAKRENYRSIILLSSPCHGRRVSNSFKHFLNLAGIKAYVQASDDVFYMRELLLEFVKVQVYRFLLR